MSSLGQPAKGGARTPGKATRAARPKQGASEAVLGSDPKTLHAGSPIPQLLNIGYGNLVIASRIVAVVSPQSAPMRRLREEASERGKLVDATHGRRTRSILVTDSDHVILSAINPETIASRITPLESLGGS